MDTVLGSWKAFYAWAMVQPVFLQVVIGLTLFFLGLVVAVLIFGPLFRWISAKRR